MARTATSRTTARKAKTAAKRPTNAKRPTVAKRPTAAERPTNAKPTATAKPTAAGKPAAASKRPAASERLANAKRSTTAKQSANSNRQATTAPAKTARRPARPAAKPSVGSPKAPQRFNVSHHREEDFKANGLRAYALYRDLGIALASGGLCQAHVIRLLGPCTDEVRKRHFHETELQLVYVLKGWMKNEFEGHGEQLMQAGSCWLQPPGIEHTVLDYSDDCEVLEIIVPADFTTVELAG